MDILVVYLCGARIAVALHGYVCCAPGSAGEGRVSIHEEVRIGCALQGKVMEGKALTFPLSFRGRHSRDGKEEVPSWQKKLNSPDSELLCLMEPSIREEECIWRTNLTVV